MSFDRFRIVCVAAAALSLAVAAIAAPAAPQQKKMSAAEIQALARKIRPDGYTSAEVCGSCHTDIHKAWSESAHARSVTDPVFRAGLAESVERHGKDTQRLCLTCHAPTTRFTKSADLEDPLVQEGITCDFCHTVKSVDLARKEEPFEMVPGLTKYGPFEYAPSPAHQTAFSVLHRNKPTLCAACHEYTNARNFPALTTYSEWLKSPYPAQGVSCQDCHMALIQGETVNPSVRIRDVGSYRFVNLHRLVGGGSLGQLRRGLDLTVLSSEARGESGYVEVEIANTAAGHKIPTGLPSKQLVLTVRVLSGGAESWKKSVVYERRVYDAKSRLIRTDGDLFLAAVRQGRDDRIAPGEKRRESFRFPLKSGSMEAEITLAYRYHAPGAAEPKLLVITRESREIRRR